MDTLAKKEYEFLDPKFDDFDPSSLGKVHVRTQDLGVWFSKYETVPKYSEISSKWSIDALYTSAIDDPIFGYLKFSDKSNYKPGLVNSLSIFEHPFMFQIYTGLVLLTAWVKKRPETDEDIDTLVEKLSEKISIFQKLLSELESQPGKSQLNYRYRL